VQDRHISWDDVVDCHVHVVGPLHRFPQASGRHYTAAVASVEDLRSVAPAEVSRFVVVQPSFYGTDNRVTLDAVAALQGKGRAVIVLDPRTATAAQLEDLHAQGVRGLRINLNSALKDDVREISDEIALHCHAAQAMGWHIELVLPLDTLIGASELIAALPVQVVIDHFGLPIGHSPGSEAGRSLLRLFELPHVWIKLSAPYRVGSDPLSTTPPADWIAAIVARAPDRCLWGSDWPHTPAKTEQRSRDEAAPYRPIAYGDLLDGFCAAMPRDAMFRATRTNPEKLYEFSSN
jgi:predicted TIM-barrel fold metal-dependent hydrolase